MCDGARRRGCGTRSRTPSRAPRAPRRAEVQLRADAVAQRLGQRRGIVHAHRLDAVALGHRGDFERGQVEAGRAGDLLDVAEPLEDRVLLVAQHEEGDRDVVGDRGPERLDRVLRGALAEHAHDRPVRLGHLHADRGGQREAEAAAGGEVVRARPREPQPRAQRERRRGRLGDDDRRRPGTPRRARRSPPPGASGRSPRAAPAAAAAPAPRARRGRSRRAAPRA